MLVLLCISWTFCFALFKSERIQRGGHLKVKRKITMNCFLQIRTWITFEDIDRETQNDTSVVW